MTTYTIRETTWDDQPNSNFRLLHAFNEIEITNPGTISVAHADAGGRGVSSGAPNVFQTPGWSSDTIDIGDVQIEVYWKTNVTIPGHPEKSRVIMFAVGQELLGTVQAEDASGHTGQWR